MKRIKAGDMCYVVIHSREVAGGFPEAITHKVIQFWTGEGFIGGGVTSYQNAKLFKTEKAAEDAAAALILSDPARFMDSIEISEQIAWKDIWA